MQILGKFTKLSYAKYIGHLDLVALLIRAFKRAGVKLSFSEGFHPQPRLSIANPLPLGIESQCEYAQLQTDGDYDLGKVKDRVNDQLAEGIDFIELREYKKIKIDKLISQMEYKVYLAKKVDMVEIGNIMGKIDQADQYIVIREKRRKGKIYEVPFDIKSFLLDYRIDEEGKTISYLSKASVGGNLRASMLVDLLNNEGMDIDYDQTRVIRLSQKDIRGQELI